MKLRLESVGPGTPIRGCTFAVELDEQQRRWYVALESKWDMGETRTCPW